MQWLLGAFLIGLACLIVLLTGGIQMDSWQHMYSPDQWVALAMYLAWSPVIVWVIRKVLRLAFRIRRKFLELPVTETSAKAARRAASLIFAAALWYWFVPIEDLPYPWHIYQGLHFVLIVASVWLVVEGWEGLCDSLVLRSNGLDRRAEKLLIPVTRKFVRVAILIAGALVLLGTYSVDWKGIVAGLGIGGLVVALAAKDSVENIFGSMTILFDMPFALGDWVKVAGVDGVVEEINLRSTRIRTFEDSIVTVPNSNLIKATVENMGARRVRRQKFLIRLSYETKSHTVEQLSQQLVGFLDHMKGVHPGKSIVQMNDLAEASFGMLVLCYFDAAYQEQEMQMRGEIMRKILELAEELGAEFFNGQQRVEGPNA